MADKNIPIEREPQVLIIPKWVAVVVVSIAIASIGGFIGQIRSEASSREEFIRWASKLESKIDANAAMIAERTFDRFTGSEGRAMKDRLEAIERKIERLERKTN